MKAVIERPSFGEMLQLAGREAGLSIEVLSPGEWWRCDLVLAEPESVVFGEIEARPELWAPAVFGIGRCPSVQARQWAWAWFEDEERSAQALSWHLPRVAQRGSIRRDLRRSLAHDLRSPLGVVSGYCELLGEELLGPLQPKQRNAVATIAGQSERLLGGLEELAARLMAPSDATD